MENLGTRLKTLREEQRLSQQQLARIIGTTQNNIYRYEHDFAEPNLTLLSRYADVFRVTTDFLLGRDPDKVNDVDLSRVNQCLKADLKPGQPGYAAIRQALIDLIDEENSPLMKALEEKIEKQRNVHSIVS